MNFEIIKLDNFSGKEASIYTVYVEEFETTLFDRFLMENKEDHLDEVKIL